MRKVIFNMSMSLDGFFCRPNGELDWMSQVPDKELNNDTVAFYDGIECGFIGYPTGVGMIAYWSSVARNASASEAEKTIAKAVNKLHPILVTDREEKPGSAEDEMLVARNDDELVAAVIKTKQRSGGDLAISGGIRTVQKFVRLGLVDEYVILIHPVAIGNGKRIFTGRRNLELTSSKTYKSGVMRVHYRPVQGTA